MLPVEPKAPAPPNGAVGAGPPAAPATSPRACSEAPFSSSKKPAMRSLEATAVSAREMLASAGEIASRVGYSSQSAFAAAMLKAFGSSPGALRRESGDN